MRAAWGEGLESKYYFNQRLALRRNSLVYEIRVSIFRLRVTFVYYRQKK